MSSPDDHPIDPRSATRHTRRSVLTALGAAGAVASGLVTPGDLAAKKKKKKTWSYSTKFGSDGNGDNNFHNPYAVAISANKRTAWVADNANHRIAIWTRPTANSTVWTFSTKFGSNGTGDAEFDLPSDIAISADELTAFVADQGNNRISIWTRPNDTSTTWSYSSQFGTAGTGDRNLLAPVGVALSADGLTTFVSDALNNRVVIWTRESNPTDWSYSTKFGTYGSGVGQLYGQAGLALSANGRTLLVADYGNNRISVWDRQDANATSWTNSTTFGTFGSGPGNLSSPFDVALSADGRTAWVADNYNHRISIWTRTGANSTTWTNTTTFGSLGSDDPNFNYPQSVAVSSDGNTLWVADTVNHRISIWKYA